MADWAIISSMATAGGTLILAVATYASVRSARRGALATERALLAGIRPVLVPSRIDDRPLKVGFADNHWVEVDGGHGVAEITDDAIYLAIALRNVGNGLAVLDRWDSYADPGTRDTDHRDPDQFRRLTRDIYVPSGDVGFWQGAYRDKDDPQFESVRHGIAERRNITIDLLYGDHEGGQRTISRFTMIPGDDDAWVTSVSRHWNLDRANPR